MNMRLIYLCLLLCFAQNLTAQLVSLGLIEESSIKDAESNGIKNGHMHFIPELSFMDGYLYVATPNGLYKHQYKMSGESSLWEKLPLTDDAVIGFDVHGDTLVLLTRNELLLSLDGGKTSRNISLKEIMGDSDAALEGMAVHPHHAKQIFITNGEKLLYTCDGGVVWSENENQVHLTGLFYNPYNANQLVGFYNNRIQDYSCLLFCRDGGYLWEESKGYYIEGNIAEIYSIAFHPTDIDKAIACGLNVYAYSMDYGTSWSGVWNPTWMQPIVHVTDIVFDFRNPNIIYGADMTASNEGAISVLRSIDGGQTWEEFFYANIAPQSHVLSLDIEDNILALYTYDGGIYLLDVDAVDNSVAPVVNDKGDTPYYDLLGRPVAHPTRGIYIKDGKKVAIK
ncbi:MAG: hypothetical protein IJA98_00880 [Bacteroidaceae bacterium]|nr:hypothetical protein [Bacteroidaceae bacterium]